MNSRPQHKIISLEELAAWRGDYFGRVIATNGCFDILHIGHIAMLQESALMGDILVVGINSDESVTALKGPHRPINRLADRAAVVAALECVGLV